MLGHPSSQTPRVGTDEQGRACHVFSLKKELVARSREIAMVRDALAETQRALAASEEKVSRLQHQLDQLRRSSTIEQRTMQDTNPPTGEEGAPEVTVLEDAVIPSTSPLLMPPSLPFEGEQPTENTSDELATLRARVVELERLVETERQSWTQAQRRPTATTTGDSSEDLRRSMRKMEQAMDLANAEQERQAKVIMDQRTEIAVLKSFITVHHSYLASDANRPAGLLHPVELQSGRIGRSAKHGDSRVRSWSLTNLMGLACF